MRRSCPSRHGTSLALVSQNAASAPRGVVPDMLGGKPMELSRGQVAVVTGAGSGIGLALAERWASAGLHVVVADVEQAALDAAADAVRRHGVEVLAVRTDVADPAAVDGLAAATLDRFGAVHLVCNNAGVMSRANVWFGPLETWRWVMDVNFWGIVHGCRTFLPHLVNGGHIVNTASIAGLLPGFGPAYDASKHAVIAISEDLYDTVQLAGLPVGVSVLCPGWVRTNIFDAERNWPEAAGPRPDADPAFATMDPHFQRALAEAPTPASIADSVADAVAADQFWIIPHQDFFDLAIDRWGRITDRVNPRAPEQMPGVPPRAQLVAEALAGLGGRDGVAAE